jgi:hypothetical protein
MCSECGTVKKKLDLKMALGRNGEEGVVKGWGRVANEEPGRAMALLG